MMTWYEVLVPAAIIALGARLEANLLGPYWSWVELLPDISDENNHTARQRRSALARRIAIPGIAAFLLAILWPGHYDSWDGALIGAIGAGLIIWPLVFHGIPWGLSIGRSVLLYGSFVGAYSVSGYLGAHIAAYTTERGGVGAFLEENLLSMIFSSVLLVFLSAVFDRTSTTVSRRRSEPDFEADPKDD